MLGNTVTASPFPPNWKHYVDHATVLIVKCKHLPCPFLYTTPISGQAKSQLKVSHARLTDFTVEAVTF